MKKKTQPVYVTPEQVAKAQQESPNQRHVPEAGIKGAMYYDLKAELIKQDTEVRLIEQAIIDKVYSLRSHGIALPIDESKIIILLSMGNYNKVLDFHMSYNNYLVSFTFNNDPTSFNRYVGFQMYGITCLPCAALGDNEMKAVYDIDPA